MSRPFRVYAFKLAERLGLKSPEEVYKELTPTQIYEWMAYDITSSPEWIKKYQEEEEQKRIEKLSAEEQSAIVKKLLGGING